MVCVVVLVSSSFASCTGVSAAVTVPAKKMSDRQLGRRKFFIIKIVIGQSGAYIEGNEFKMQYKASRTGRCRLAPEFLFRRASGVG